MNTWSSIVLGWLKFTVMPIYALSTVCHTRLEFWDYRIILLVALSAIAYYYL